MVNGEVDSRGEEEEMSREDKVEYTSLDLGMHAL